MTPKQLESLARLLASAIERNDRRTLALASALAQHDRAILLAGIRQAGKGKGPGWLADAVGVLWFAGQEWRWAHEILLLDALMYSPHCFTQAQKKILYTI